MRSPWSELRRSIQSQGGFREKWLQKWGELRVVGRHIPKHERIESVVESPKAVALLGQMWKVEDKDGRGK